MVSVIIPAFNEESTIGRVVSEIIRHPNVEEVIVVSDGSTDRTADVAAKAGARVISLAKNSGKAVAMDAGVAAAKNEAIFFMDADVVGHTHENISKIIDPVISGKYVMFVGIRARSTFWLNRLMHYFPIIGGERALLKSLWHQVPAYCKTRFKIEIALNYTSKRIDGRGMGFTLINGVRHFIKEEKYGFWVGFRRRMFMSWDVFSVSFFLYLVRPITSLFLRKEKVQ